MKKLRLAVIGQGRSGLQIHGAYYMSEQNQYFEVCYVVDADEISRERALTRYPGCEALSDYTQLFGKKLDLVVNASYSDNHYPITKDLLLHGFNVLCEKPFGRNRFEADDLIRTAKEKGLICTCFQQTMLAPWYKAAKAFVDSGALGELKQIDVKYSGLARRWDWQTLQAKMAGSVYNTGPHPIGVALGFLDFDPQVRVAFSRLGSYLVSGDADDYGKIILTAPGKPIADIEISALDAFQPWNLKLQGTLGTYVTTMNDYKFKVIDPEANEPQPLHWETLRDENHEPIYCGEKLNFKEGEGHLEGTAWVQAVWDFYENLYHVLLGEAELLVPPEVARDVVTIIEAVHAENPLERKF